MSTRNKPIIDQLRKTLLSLQFDRSEANIYSAEQLADERDVLTFALVELQVHVKTNEHARAIMEAGK